MEPSGALFSSPETHAFLSLVCDFVLPIKQLKAAEDVFTWWVIALVARQKKDKPGELEALKKGIALGAHSSVWHVLMVNRASELESD